MELELQWINLMIKYTYMYYLVKYNSYPTMKILNNEKVCGRKTYDTP